VTGLDWLAFDADGVLQSSVVSRAHLLDGLASGDRRARILDALAVLEADHLVRPGFASVFAALCRASGLGAHITTLTERYAMTVPNRAVLRQLAQARQHGHRVALLTNQTDLREEAMLRTFPDEVFDAIVTSQRIGYAKPDPAFFTVATRVLSAEPSRIGFFDDRRENVDAAAALGYQSWVVEPGCGDVPIAPLHDLLRAGPEGAPATTARPRRNILERRG
jgi:putative hydrolase of the HAD superfamily